MDKKTFHHEVAFQISLHMIREMQEKKLISGKEYKAAEAMLLKKYQPFTGDLFTC